MTYPHPSRERRSGSGEFMTLREAMTKGGQSSKIPSFEPEPLWQYLIDEYWDLKMGDPDGRITKADLRDTLLDRNEKRIIVAMDRAFMASLAKERAAAEKAQADKARKK